MAKSRRASRVKSNSANRRDTIHRPTEDARLQRLSEKLLEAAKANKPTNIAPMEVDGNNTEGNVGGVEAKVEPAMAMDVGKEGKQPATAKRFRRKTAKRSIVFPGIRKKTRSGGKNKKR